MMTVTEEMLDKMLKNFGAGLQVRVHVIGDGSARKVIDVVEEARKLYPENTRPMHLAHATFVHPDDMRRMAELNIYAEVSPPTYFNFPLGSRYPTVMGAIRNAKRNDIAGFIEAGVMVTYGSDWPAVAPNASAFRSIEGMITAKTLTKTIRAARSERP